jgi:hypothetical protein
VGGFVGLSDPASGTGEPFTKEGEDAVCWGLEAGRDEEGGTTEVHTSWEGA